MDLLKKYLNKLGLQSYEELTSDEKETYKLWEESISGRKLTDEDVSIFLQTELSQAIQRLTEVNLSKEDEIYRKCEVRMIQKIQKFLESPKIEKAMIEKQISSML
jgi:hypothetical protein